MASKPDIAVMMLLYNSGEDLRRALNSLAAQTYKNFYLVIVDDCSPTNCYSIAKEYESRFEHFHLSKNEKNKGVINNLYDTLQLVEHLAPTAEFFVWACADDWWEPEFLETTRQILLNNPDAATCQTWFDKLDTKTGEIETHKMPSLKSSKYSIAKRIFRPYLTDGKNGYYNQSIHGLLRIDTLRAIYPDDKRQIGNISCSELSALIVMLLRGSILFHPQVMFHKIKTKSFAEKYPNDSLAKLYKNSFLRIRAVLGHLPYFFKIKKRTASPLSILALWAHLFYFYGILGTAQTLKAKFSGKS